MPSDGLQGRAPAAHPSTRLSESHSCIRKAVELLGIGSASIRTIAVDDSYRIDVAALEAAIERDVATRYRPLASGGLSDGTVNTGAIDPLVEVAAVCRRHGA